MFNISFETELDRMKDALSLFDERRQSFIVMNTLNNAAFAALKQLRADTPRYIDRPKAFTVNSSRVFKATRQLLKAEIDYKSGLGYNPGTTPGDYLKAVVYGGGRRHKRFESALIRAAILPSSMYIVPTDNVPKDQYGGVSGGYYTKVLSFLRVSPDSLQNRRVEKYKKYNTSKFVKSFAKGVFNKEKLVKKEERAAGRAARFVVMMQGRNGWTGASGIYERNTTLGGKRNSSFKLVFAFISSPTYRKTFPFYEILNTSTKAAFPEAFSQAVQSELMKLAKKSTKKV